MEEGQRLLTNMLFLARKILVGLGQNFEHVARCFATTEIQRRKAFMHIHHRFGQLVRTEVRIEDSP